MRGVVIAALALAGCAELEVRHQPLEVQVPVTVPCAVQVPDEPKWLVDALPPTADDFAVAKAYRAERAQRRQYVTELKAAIAGCAKGAP